MAEFPKPDRTEVKVLLALSIIASIGILIQLTTTHTLPIGLPPAPVWILAIESWAVGSVLLGFTLYVIFFTLALGFQSLPLTNTIGEALEWVSEGTFVVAAVVLAGSGVVFVIRLLL